MSKIVTLTDPETNEPQYPQTSTNAVYDDNGVSIEKHLQAIYAALPSATRPTTND